jgi:subtilisin-like proprotein convertase family protein
MKKLVIIIGGLMVALAPVARADFSQSFGSGVAIPDNDLNGWSTTLNVSGAPTAIPNGALTVTLNLSGGWNGDLYAYLVHNGSMAVLLNRVGRTADNPAGYGDPGMSVTLSDAALVNIHSYGGTGVPTGMYKPDGRNISPLASLDTTIPTALLSAFNGQNMNGNWTLFLADTSEGEQTKITSWGIDIAAVAEPGSAIEGGVAVLFLGGVVGMYRLRGARAGATPAAGT